MEPPSEPQGRRKRIQSEALPPDNRLELQVRKCAKPSRPGPVPVCQVHSMPGVAHPIHQAQGRLIQPVFGQVILDHDASPGDSGRLAQEQIGGRGMVQDVDQQGVVHRSIRGRYRQAVVQVNLDMGGRTQQDVEATNRKIRPGLEDLMGEQPIARSKIQHARRAGQEPFDNSRKNPHPPWCNQAGVRPSDQGHRRARPRILTKKLESTAWTPMVVTVTPGMTHRIVLA